LAQSKRVIGVLLPLVFLFTAIFPCICAGPDVLPWVMFFYKGKWYIIKRLNTAEGRRG
jgi:hypothetical protein